MFLFGISLVEISAGFKSDNYYTWNTNKAHAKVLECDDRIQFPILDSGIPEFPFKVLVYGIPMFATSRWSEEKLNHVASVLAELLDQNEDGCADDGYVLQSILQARFEVDLGQSAVLLTNTLSDHEFDIGREIIEKAGFYVAVLLAEKETILECTGLNFNHTCSDASIEELFHLISDVGLVLVYPSIFRTQSIIRSSNLTRAMDIARGGHFRRIPSHYPANAWYTYYDEECDYWCQGTEYTWWGYCAYSGICEGRSGAPYYENEFRFLTKSEFVTGDVLLSDLFKNSGDFDHPYDLEQYVIPTMPVDGKYYGCKICTNGGPNHGGH